MGVADQLLMRSWGRHGADVVQSSGAGQPQGLRQLLAGCPVGPECRQAAPPWVSGNWTSHLVAAALSDGVSQEVPAEAAWPSLSWPWISAS